MGAVALHLSRAGPPDVEVTRRMLAAAPHRGDERNVETLGQVVLGVTNEPDWITATLARDEEYAVAFCGTLDNEAELRKQLRRAGVPGPAAATPAATFLALFRHLDVEAVPRLRGKFAGAVTDGRYILCFRDQFGTRPLFHHDGPNGFFAATEVKQVLAGASLTREPDLDHLHGLLFGGIDGSTAYRGVERIPRRNVARADDRPGITTREYWDPGSYVETSNLGFRDAVEGTREALDRAVRRVLSGRDILLLSGGLDSPAIAAFAKRAEGGGESVRALTGTYPDHPSVDELEWTERAANHVGMKLHHHVAEAGALDDLETWLTVLDGPVVIFSIPEVAEFYTVSRRLGARTVINGEIAEHLFHTRSNLLDHLLSHGRLRAAARELAGLRQAGVTRRRLARRIIRSLAPPSLVAVYRKGKPSTPDVLPPWMDAGHWTPSWPGPPLWRMSPRQRWKAVQTAPFVGSGIDFEAEEICSAACGVESRRPFADVDLWEFVLSLPAEVKFPNRRTKPLLRESMRGFLPDALIDRRDKTYFDEYQLARADWEKLRRLLTAPSVRLEGIDYVELREQVEAKALPAWELTWARGVARVHAFLDQW